MQAPSGSVENSSRTLPIEAVLAEVCAALENGTRLVLAAPPGAGKTTRVPLQLLDADWLDGQRIILLEPRRIAARMAAERMAATLGERVGDTVGLRTRLDTRVSGKTRLEVVTEGVFTRMALSDPGLEGIGAVIFDEIHERALTADMGLALALEVQGALRENLRIIAMSATLDTARIAAVIDATIVESQGRSFPVETIYLGRDRDQRVEDAMAQALRRALREQAGSILCFLPGQGEIERTAERLGDLPGDVILAPLYGALDARAQDRAVSPAPPGTRKVVLATDIAESALTIDGVRVVIDAGLARIPETDAATGVSRLVTRRAARANVDQRRGRAGRTAPGVCYRLWHEPETRGLTPEPVPEILSSDLSGLVLDLASFGERDPARLTWIDPPPAGRLQAARAQLQTLGLLGGEGEITPLGRAAAKLPLPPRLAVLVARNSGADRALAARMAIVLSERGLGGASSDLGERLRRLEVGHSPRERRARDLAARWSAQGDVGGSAQSDLARILLEAWPDRLARARDRDAQPGMFLLASGQAGRLEPGDPLARREWIAVADLGGGSGVARITAAVPVEDSVARKRVETATLHAFSPETGQVSAKRVTRIGAITLSETPLPKPKGEAVTEALLEAVETYGLDLLARRPALDTLAARLSLLHSVFGAPWPADFEQVLIARLDEWLRPILDQTPDLAAISGGELANAARALLDWPLPRDLDELAPTHFETPAGSRLAIDYLAETAPLVNCRVQEVFGLDAHPRIGGGRVAIRFSLLSPARRQVALTSDLPRFWRGGYADLRKDMKGRYPKHDWPENPAAASAHKGRTKRTF